jgi:very-short-patch-repair endonuclease
MTIKNKHLHSPLPQAGEEQRRGKILDNAKILHSHQTEVEKRLWYHLRAHRFMGLKFKRQKPMGRYIVDFVCVERRLIIELDGGQHAERMAYDQQRDTWLRNQGYRVLRFWNNEVMQQLEGVLETIRSAILQSALSPSPSPTSVRGERESSPLPQMERESSTHPQKGNIPSPLQGEG